MSDWIQIRIEEIGEVVGGGTPSTKESSYYNGDISWITPKDLSGYNFRFISKGSISITEEGLKKSSAKLLPKGTVLLSSRAPIGYVAIAGKELSTNQGFKSIICNEKIFNEFLYYILKINKEKLESIASGATFKEVSGGLLKSFEITIPKSLTTQKKIATILSNYDELIENNNKRIEILEQQAKLVYDEWFIKFKFPNHEEVEFEESELGIKPKDWEIKKIPEVIFFQEGPGLRKWQWTNNGIKVINVKNILKDRTIEIENTDRYISWSEFEKRYKHFEIEENDILVASSGNTYGKIGKIQKYHLPIMMNTSVIRFKPLHNLINYDYMYMFLKSEYFKTLMDNFAIGSAQPNFGPAHLKQMKILYPTLKIQHSFGNYIESLHKEIDILITKNQNLRKTRDLLLPKLMSGELSTENLNITINEE